MRSLIRAHLVQDLAARPDGTDYAVLLERARFLDAADRQLLAAVFDRGLSATEIARLQGLSPRVVQSRVRRLHQRLVSRRYIEAMRALPHLDPLKRELVLRHILRRRPVKQIARELGHTVHHVRLQLALAQGAIAERAILTGARPVTAGSPAQT